jgi:hypothetical protein
VTAAGKRFRVERDKVDVTPMSEPDPAWRFTDSHGHEHAWVNEEVPTLRTIVDYEGGDEFPSVWHYECVLCGDTVRPGLRAVTERRYALGLTHCYIDDVPVSNEEFERQAHEHGLLNGRTNRPDGG